VNETTACKRRYSEREREREKYVLGQCAAQHCLASSAHSQPHAHQLPQPAVVSLVALVQEQSQLLLLLLQ